MQKGRGALKILEVRKRGPENKNKKKHADTFTPDNWGYVIFSRVDTYFPWGKMGALKNFAVHTQQMIASELTHT